MAKSKTNKRTLFTAVVTLVMCLVMFVGSTYAWFTDQVSNSGNKIKTGSLKVDLQVLEDDNTTWTSIKEDLDPIFDYDRLQPGYIQVTILKVVNQGNLALKWKAQLASESELTPLANVIDVYVKEEASTYPTATERSTYLNDWTKVGTLASFINTIEITTTGFIAENDEEVLGIAFKMKESAGNEYQDMELGAFDIRILATQYTAESDSFDDQYDVDADFDGEISNVTSLNAAVEAGGTYKLVKDITLASAIEVPADTQSTIDLAGKTISVATGNAFINNGNLTLVDSALSASARSTTSIVRSESAYAIKNNAILTIDGITVDGGIYNSGSLTVDSGNVVTTRGDSSHAIYHNGTDLTINGGYFSGNGNEVINANTSEAVINGGTFTKVEKESYLLAGSNMVIKGGTFNAIEPAATNKVRDGVRIEGGTFNYDPSTQLPTGYMALEYKDAYLVATTGSAIAEDDDSFNQVIADGNTNILLGSGTFHVPASAKGKTLTITGLEDTVIEIVPSGGGEAGGQLDYNFDGSTVTFNNLTIKSNNNTYAGYARLSATYNNCTFINHYSLQRTSEFNDCKFFVTGDQYNIWTWGAPVATFNRCTFNSDGKAMLLYGTADTTLTLNDCVFNDTGVLPDLKTAVEIGNDGGRTFELIINNIIVNGYEFNDKGIQTNSKIWSNKNSMDTDQLNVVIDGVDVY